MIVATAATMFESDDDEELNNLRFFDIGHVTHEDEKSSLIIDCLNSPLASFEEACKPLENLIDNIQTKVYIIRQQQQMGNHNCVCLVPDESAAIQLYTWEWSPHSTCIYFILNETLRHPLANSVLWYSYLKLLLTAIDKLPPIERCTLYRGIRLCDLSGEYEDDKVYTWWNITSCLQSQEQMTSRIFLGTHGTRTLFQIDCYSGKKNPLSQDGDEVILMPGFHFQVIGKLRSLDELNTIYIREIEPSSLTLIKPPIIATTAIAVEEEPSLAPEEVKKKHRRKSTLTKTKKTFKSTALRLIEMSKLSNECADHILEFSNKKLSIDELNLSLNERLTQKITILNLSNTNLIKEKVKIIADMLKTNQTLDELNLSYNSLGNAGCILIAQALYHNQHLKNLSLYNTKISSDSSCYLGEMLAVNKRLRSLHLGVNSLGNLGVKYLFIEGSNIQLHYLNLCCNRIDHEGCQYLVKMLARNETLTYFDIGGNAIKDRGVQEICNSLLNNQTLTELHMWHCQITDSNAIGDLLKSNLTLVELDLEGNHITDNGGMIIADILLSTTIKSKTLKLLNLSHNKITDKCTKRLITITDLTVVV